MLIVCYSKLEAEYDEHCDIVNDRLVKYQKVEDTVNIPTEKLRRCLDARALHKGHLDVYMEEQVFTIDNTISTLMYRLISNQRSFTIL